MLKRVHLPDAMKRLARTARGARADREGLLQVRGRPSRSTCASGNRSPALGPGQPRLTFCDYRTLAVLDAELGDKVKRNRANAWDAASAGATTPRTMTRRNEVIT